ncbi:MAG: DNRLRE domain-containing protein, partial [Candidatus Aenigmatarchaeota archaeon]
MYSRKNLKAYIGAVGATKLTAIIAIACILGVFVVSMANVFAVEEKAISFSVTDGSNPSSNVAISIYTSLTLEGPYSLYASVLTNAEGLATLNAPVDKYAYFVAEKVGYETEWPTEANGVYSEAEDKHVIFVNDIDNSAPIPLTLEIIPFIWTDKSDYSPEDIVYIYGGGFDYTQVTLRIIDPSNNILVDEPVSVDNNGNFQYVYDVDGIVGTYTIDVLDSNENILASTTFDDSYTTTTVTLNPIDDLYVDNFDPNTNLDGGNGLGCLHVKSQSNGLLRRSYLKFDLSSLPNDATITSAKLKVYRHAGDSQDRSIGVYTVSKYHPTVVTYNPTSGYDYTDGGYTLTSFDLAKLSSSDNNRYAIQSDWADDLWTDYLSFGFSPNIPEGSTISSVVLKFEWYADNGISTQNDAQIKVWDQSESTWRTYTLPDRPTNDRTDAIELSKYINTVADVNNFKFNFSAEDGPGTQKTYHDWIMLEVAYTPPFTATEWTETSLEWYDAPTDFNLVASTNVGNPDGYKEWTVTVPVQNAFSGDKIVSFAMKLTDETPTQHQDFCDMEHTCGGCSEITPPKLEITYQTPVPCSSHKTEADCEQDQDCDWCPECSGNQYSGGPDRCVESGQCSYSCYSDYCGATCSSDGDCQNYCDGLIWKFAGECCGSNCSCIYTENNCDDSNLCTIDSCDPTNGCSHPPKDCSDGNVCTQDSCNPSTGECYHTWIQGCCVTDDDCSADYYTCDGNLIIKHDVYCEQSSHTCQETASQHDNCDRFNQDSCYDTYYWQHQTGTCVSGNSQCAVASSTGDCRDEYWCNGQEYCYQNTGTCVAGTPVNCSEYNIPGIATCDNDPDAYHPTWDFRNAFTSECVEDGQNNGHCTRGDDTITHTCDVAQCNAECDETHVCADRCSTGDVYEYDGTCLQDCTCQYRGQRDCDQYDGWYCNGDNMEYRDYYCDVNGVDGCSYAVTQTQSCDDEDPCTIDTCEDRDGPMCVNTHSDPTGPVTDIIIVTPDPSCGKISFNATISDNCTEISDGLFAIDFCPIPGFGGYQVLPLDDGSYDGDKKQERVGGVDFVLSGLNDGRHNLYVR